MVDMILQAAPDNSKELQACLDQVGTGKKYSELHVSGTTTLDKQVLLSNGQKITCDPGTVWKLGANVPLAIQVPMIGQRGSTITGLYIEGLTIDGNYLAQTKTPDDHGRGYGNAFGLSGVSKSTFKKVTIRNSEGDGFRIYKGSGLKFDGCVGDKYGHDFIHINQCSDVIISGCKVTLRANNAVRVRGSNKVTITGNTFTGSSAAYAPAIQIEQMEAGSQYDITVSGNTITGVYGPGIYIAGTRPLSDQKGIVIRGNKISKCGLVPKTAKLSYVGGIVFDGVTDLEISGNTITDCLGYGIAFADYLTNVKGKSGAVVTITGNTIKNTKVANYPATGSGSAIFAVDKRCTIKCTGNKLSGNKINYTGVAGSK